MEPKDHADTDVETTNNKAISSDRSEHDRAINILALEYSALRAEITGRQSGRFQFLGFTTAAAALLGSVIGSSSFSSKDWILLGLAFAVLIFGLICFMRLGKMLTEASAQVADIEQRINALASDPSSVRPLLTWDSLHQTRTPLENLSLGLSPFSARTVRDRS